MGAIAFLPPRRGSTYARARLRLGIAGVGSLVGLAVALLALDATAVLPDRTAWAGADVVWLALLVALYVVVSSPFDVLGGLVLPRRHGRHVPRSFARSWARGASVHGLVLLGGATGVLAAGRAGGDGAAIAASGVLAAALLAAQLLLARAVGEVSTRGCRASSGDPSFVGGIVGLPGSDRIVLSAAWDDEITRVQAARRLAVHESGSRALGVAVALAFVLLGLALVLLALPVDATSVAGIAEVALWVTLWSFLGLLVLPTLSRGAVVAADLAALERGIEPEALADALRRLDAAQEDEPSRSRLVETVFHPVPSLERRLAAVRAGAGPRLPRPWHAARTALYLSSATLGLLSRAVHCNSGRPGLWVLYPGD